LTFCNVGFEWLIVVSEFGGQG